MRNLLMRLTNKSGIIGIAAMIAAERADEIVGNQRGAFSIDSVWTISFALIFLAILVPIGISQLNSADTDGWDATQVTVWGLIGVIAILVIAYSMYKQISGGSGPGRKRGKGM
jgi:hypothetical protein